MHYIHDLKSELKKVTLKSLVRQCENVTDNAAL